MFRSIAVIVAGILLARPDMPREDATRYAKVLQQEAKARDFDPLTGVAIIQHESAWTVDIVSDNREDYGLAQIRARYVGACKHDDDPLDSPSDECRAVKQSLLQAETNIRQMARLITDNRKLCKAKTGSASFARWLASYQGLNDPKHDQWCRPGKKTWEVINYRQHLLDQLFGGKKQPKKKH